MNVIELKNVDFKYKDGSDFLLSDINLTIEEKEFAGIIGSNGSGKSTLLKIILGLLTPSRGKVLLFGNIAKNNTSQIGYLSQYEDIDFSFPITLKEVVSMGRIKPELFSSLSKEDLQQTKKSYAKTRYLGYSKQENWKCIRWTKTKSILS